MPLKDLKFLFHSCLQAVLAKESQTNHAYCQQRDEHNEVDGKRSQVYMKLDCHYVEVDDKDMEKDGDDIEEGAVEEESKNHSGDRRVEMVVVVDKLMPKGDCRAVGDKAFGNEEDEAKEEVEENAIMFAGYKEGMYEIPSRT
mmetsp:Transcript_13259/g.18105  ORF Transcript_13259/g.18105 Transcript_13259/m.18105 type:complete len:142 (-) Transcript_13259:397-822(-)